VWGGVTGWGAGGALFMLAHVLWWIFLIVGIIALVRWILGSGQGVRRAEEDPALSILRERYARGEIDKAEFEARKRDLG